MATKKAPLAGRATENGIVDSYYRIPASDASGIFYLPDLPADDDGPGAAYLRESQEYKDVERYFADQWEALRAAVTRHGNRIVGKPKRDMKPGEDMDRPELRRIYRKALCTGVCRIFVLNIDRLIRHPKFHAVRNPIHATEEQKAEFVKRFPGVQWVLIERDEEIESYRTKRGQESTGYKPGGDWMPGHVKRRKADKLALVLECREHNIGYGTIARWTGIPKPTVRRWIKACPSGYHSSCER
jgi:DNA invertase Pin-like site-specific DNA recombinase